jgi:hypothetical protein
LLHCCDAQVVRSPSHDAAERDTKPGEAAESLDAERHLIASPFIVSTSSIVQIIKIGSKGITIPVLSDSSEYQLSAKH